MKIKQVCLLALLFSLIYLGELSAQNLIKNSSFEQINNKPCDWVQDKVEFDNILEFWTMPTLGTPDVWYMEADPLCRLTLKVNNDLDFNADEVEKKPYLESIFPHSGDAYLGLMTRNGLKVDGNITEYREYAMIELFDTLKKGQKYQFEMFVAWAKGCKYSSNGIGAAFSEQMVEKNSKDVLKDIKPFVYFKNIVNADSTSWHILSTTFEATGKEKFLIIGNFFENSKTLFKEEKSFVNYATDTNKSMAYYFIDDVLLMDYESFLKKDVDTLFADYAETTYSDTPIEKIDMSAIKLSKRIVLDNILFNVNESKLLAGSQSTLNKLLALMKSDDNMHLLIIGHTDNQGNSDHNLTLSSNRANAVRDFLVQNGIPSEKIRSEGYGDKQPMMGNDTEEGRKKNRRVELVFNK